MDWTTIPSKPRYPAEPVHQEDPLRAQLFLASLFVQLLLRHPRFHSSAWAKLFRIALAPVSIYLALRTPLLHLWQPLEKAAHLRVAIAVQCFFGAMMAIDFAFTDDVFHRVPLDSPTRQTQQGEVANGAAKGQDKAEQLAEHSHGPWEVILWTAEQVFNLRGIGWSWGLPPSRLAPAHSGPWGLVRRLFILNSIVTPSFAYCMLSRETRPRPYDAYKTLHDLLGAPVFAGSRVVANALLTAAFGWVVLGMMDLYYTAFALAVYLIQSALHGLLPSLIPPFDFVRWPPLYDSPHLSESIADLWGKRWHAIFRRSFDVCGYRPAAWLAYKCGGSKRAQKAIGVFGVFVLSGVMHEYAIWHFDPPYDSISAQGFPRTLSYFVLQGVAALLIEPLLLPRLKFKWLRILWVWSFTLVTAHSFRIAYLESGVSTSFPSPRVWAWPRWFVPTVSGFFGDAFTV